MIVCTILGGFMVFRKMGFTGWQWVVPGYNLWLLCREMYGRGNRVFMMLIPGYGLYVMIRMWIDVARAFGRPVGFGVGLALVSPVFLMILGLSASTYTRPAASEQFGRSLTQPPAPGYAPQTQGYVPPVPVGQTTSPGQD